MERNSSCRLESRSGHPPYTIEGSVLFRTFTNQSLFRTRVLTNGNPAIHSNLNLLNSSVEYDSFTPTTISKRVPSPEYVHNNRPYTVEAFVAASSAWTRVVRGEGSAGRKSLKDSIFKGEVTTVYHIGTHNNLIKSFGAFVHRDQLCLRFEWAPFTLRRRIKEGLTLSKVKAITKGLGEGLAYIHSENVIHRDVKEANVLLTGAGLNPLITDFGLSLCLRQPTDKATRKCGTERNWAPELRRNEPYDNKVDMFAFGVILLRMLESVITEGTQDLLTEDLPTTRYSAVQALMHPFLATTVEQQSTEGKGAYERQPSVNSSSTIGGQSEVQSKAVDDTAGQREEMREREWRSG
ncbi:kinase-like domain-containing protein [Linnemannia elongata]|nr:kinase-like domain-containing protein [Linnemannia elongata]